MVRLFRRRAVEVGVRFCDGCAEVSTAAERAWRQRERIRADIHAITGIR